MLLQRQQITDGTATAKAHDNSLKRWTAQSLFLDDAQLPIDNNWIENQIRPIAIGPIIGCLPALCEPGSAPLR